MPALKEKPFKFTNFFLSHSESLIRRAGSAHHRLVQPPGRFSFLIAKKGERAAAPPVGSKLHVIGAGLGHVIRAFTGLLGTVELADGFGTNEPGPDAFRFRVLFGAAFQL
jgi:hypothetical protein